MELLYSIFIEKHVLINNMYAVNWSVCCELWYVSGEINEYMR